MGWVRRSGFAVTEENRVRPAASRQHDAIFAF
jgi:hypothetical protein